MFNPSQTQTVVFPISDVLRDIYREEENDGIIYSIREELIENVMNEIDVIYFKRRLLNFTVDCALEALLKLVSFEYYYHNTLPKIEQDWSCDKPICPSPPDTWSSKRVPVVDATSIKIDQDQIIDEPESVGTVCYCNFLGIECLCYKTEEEKTYAVFQKLYSEESESSEKESNEISKPIPDISSVKLELIGDDIGENDQVSVKSEAVECNLEGFAQVVNKKFSMPKVIVTAAEQSSSVSKIIDLPPIRVDAMFDSNFVVENKKKKK